MTSIKVEEAQSKLASVISQLIPGQSIAIEAEGTQVAVLLRTNSGPWPCKAGSLSGTDHWMAEDFDAPLDDFAEYM
jgi:hypothetical protein